MFPPQFYAELCDTCIDDPLWNEACRNTQCYSVIVEGRRLCICWLSLWIGYMNQPLKLKCVCWNLQVCVVEIFIISKWPNTKSIIRKVLVFLPLTLAKDCIIDSSFRFFSVLTASMKVCYITLKFVILVTLVNDTFLLQWNNRSCCDGSIKYHKLTCKGFWVLAMLTFRRSVVPPFSGLSVSNLHSNFGTIWPADRT